MNGMGKNVFDSTESTEGTKGTKNVLRKGIKATEGTKDSPGIYYRYS
jgi:hypothetical protein